MPVKERRTGNVPAPDTPRPSAGDLLPFPLPRVPDAGGSAGQGLKQSWGHSEDLMRDVVNQDP